MKPSQAILQFRIAGSLMRLTAITRGNINDTYEAAFRNGASVQRVVLQRINTRVFTHPEWIMANMRVVTEHVRRKIEELYCHLDREWGFPQVVPTRDGRDFFVSDDGEYWRVLTMIDAASSWERVRDAEHAHEAGAVLGCFHRMIADLDPARLHDTLPGFHVCPKYLATYDRTIAGGGYEGRVGCRSEVRRLMRFVEDRRTLADVLEGARERGDLTTRPIHGDPKVDNVMIDDFTGKGIGLVDLDTVKPGLLHYDFGDALRSVGNRAGEDALDLSEVVFDLGVCEAFVRGYLEAASGSLTSADRAFLYDAVHLLPFELGLRFLTDYLSGDVYFKVRYEEHNLNRARVQFKLCESIEMNERAIRAILERG